MCAASYPLGFALAHSASQTSWTYRTPPDISEDRLSEAIALLATRAAFRLWMMGDSMPHLFGTQLNTTDPARRGRAGDESCEFDLVLFLDDHGLPNVIVGEVKHRGHVEQDDLSNMQAVQQWFATQGIDCWVLFATLRPALTPGERDILRTVCESAPRVRGTRIFPKFPIVLLEPELSAPMMDDDSLLGWCASRSAAELGVASCRRNLGLGQFTWSPESEPSWTCSWA
jgi:hypothetical protein